MTRTLNEIRHKIPEGSGVSLADDTGRYLEVMDMKNNTEQLRCATCGNYKSPIEFSVDTSRPRGRKYSCRKCLSVAASKRYSSDPVKHRQAVKLSRERNLMRALVDGARKRSVKKGLEFDLSDHLPDLRRRLDAGKCELTGISFQIGLGHHWASPAIDRIIPSKGYIYTNVRLILHGLNNALGNWGSDVLFDMVDSMRNRK